MASGGKFDVLASVRAIVSDAIATPAVDPDERRAHLYAGFRAIPGVESPTRRTEFAFNEYVIETGFLSGLKLHADIYNKLSPMGLAAAPRAIELIPVEGEMAVLVTRYAQCTGERLAPLESTKGPFQNLAVRQFRADMEALAAAMLVHSYAARSFHHWLVSSTTGTIVLNSWEAVERAGVEEARAALIQFDRMLSSGPPAWSAPR